MINSNLQLSISRQCKLLGVGRASAYRPRKQKYPSKHIIDIVDQTFTNYPFFGTRGLQKMILRQSHVYISRYMIRKAMRYLGVETIAPKPNTSIPFKEHKIYPYLLRKLNGIDVNQVWISDITYIRIPKGFLYLCAVMDWQSRKILSWRLSNSMDTEFCVAALEDALQKYPRPEIFNTDQGSQYTSEKFTSKVIGAGIKMSMDGKGRWMDNVMVERFWRSLKYEEVYPKRYETPAEAKIGIAKYIEFYNSQRPHTTLDDKVPDEIYFNHIQEDLAQAS